MKRAHILLLAQSTTTEIDGQLKNCPPPFFHGIDVITPPPPKKINLFLPSWLAAFDMILLAYAESNQHPRRQFLQLCHELRKRFDGPLLLISNVQDEEFQLSAYAMGVDEYIDESTATRDMMLAKLGAWYNWSIASSQMGFAGTDLHRQLPSQVGLEVQIIEWPDQLPSSL